MRPGVPTGPALTQPLGASSQSNPILFTAATDQELVGAGSSFSLMRKGRAGQEVSRQLVRSVVLEVPEAPWGGPDASSTPVGPFLLPHWVVHVWGDHES